MRRRLFWFTWAAIVALVLCSCAFTIFFLQYRFGGYDLSPLIDGGWRVLQHQVPNRDFICTFPPITYLGVALAFRILGVHWSSLSLASAFFTLTLTVCGMRILLLLRPRLGDATVLRLSLAFAVLQAVPFLVVGHPWHSTWTQAAALYAFAATFALLEVDASAPHRRWELLAHLCLAECLLILAKPNTGIPAVAFCTMALLIRQSTRVSAFATLCLAVLLASVPLLSIHSSLFKQWQVYSTLNSRFIPQGYLDLIVFHRQQYLGLEKLSAFLAVFPALLWALWRTGRDTLRHRLTTVHIVALGGCLVSLIGFGTNADYPIVDSPSLLFGAILLGATAWNTFSWFESGYFFGLYTLLALAAFFCGTRQRMQQVGEWGDICASSRMTRQHDPFFGDFRSCPAFFSVLHEADRAVAQTAGKNIFFGPRTEFLYAREHLASPHGLPLWWHPGTSYPLAAEASIVKAWEDDHFELLILLHNDRTRLPQTLLDAIDEKYVLRSVAPAKAQSQDLDRELDDGRIDVYSPRRKSD